MTTVPVSDKSGLESRIPPIPAAGFHPSDPLFLLFLARLAKAFALEIREDWKEHADTLLASSQQFLTESRDDLARWTGLLAAGALNDRDFRWLTQSRADLLRLTAMKQAGITKHRIDQFRSVLVETILATALIHFVPSRTR